MAVVIASDASVVGWFCFAVGFLILATGVGFGAAWSYKEPHTEVGAAANPEAKKQAVTAAKDTVSALQDAGIQAAQSTPSDPEKKNVEQSGYAAKSAVDELAGIIKALPERLRFWGFLILIGGLLMGVATIEFNGHSIF